MKDETHADDSAYRAAVLTGRAQALTETLQMVKRLRTGIDINAPTDVVLAQLVEGTMDLVKWLSQAVEEAKDEAEMTLPR